jgi:hypothetical protein
VLLHLAGAGTAGGCSAQRQQINSRLVLLHRSSRGKAPRFHEVCRESRHGPGDVDTLTVRANARRHTRQWQTSDCLFLQP